MIESQQARDIKLRRSLRNQPTRNRRRQIPDEHELDALVSRGEECYERGEDEDAVRFYGAVLSHDPHNRHALFGLSRIALARNALLLARRTLEDVVALYPDFLEARLCLASSYHATGADKLAFEHYERAYKTDPANPDANQGLASHYHKLHDWAAAWRYARAGFKDRSLVTHPYRGTEKNPPRVLILTDPPGGNILTRNVLDSRIFQVIELRCRYFNFRRAIPEHDVVFNAIGDADLCKDALELAKKVLKRSRAPVINRPDAVLATERLENFDRMRGIASLVVPNAVGVTRISQQRADAAQKLAKRGLQFPLLLRSLGYHSGRQCKVVRSAKGLRSAAGSLQGSRLLAIQFLDTKGHGRYFRKYRVMFVDGRILPTHLIAHRTWNLHVGNSTLRHSKKLRDEEQRFIDRPNSVISPSAWKALRKIRDTLDLDFAGIDFGTSKSGELLFFEANATMALVESSSDEIWKYRRPTEQQLIEATQGMILNRARQKRARRETD